MDAWIGPALLGGGALLFILFMVSALKKARARRRAQFADDSPPLVREGREPQPEPLPSPVAEPVPEPIAEPVAVEAPDSVAAAQAEAEAKAAAAAKAAEEAKEAAEAAAAAQARAEDEAKEAAAAAAEAEAKTQAPAVEPDQAITQGLSKTRESFMGRLGGLFKRDKVDPGLLDELEEVLLTADVGVSVTMDLLDDLRSQLKKGNLKSAESVRDELKSKVLGVLEGKSAQDILASTGTKPRVILFVGVNGVGKTTTIGKIAQKLRERDQQVVMAAGDTFRAAAAEQLAIWAERTGSKLIRDKEGTDPASVVFNAIQHGVQTEVDVVLADTAGRLHTKQELMDEIKKVKRVAGKAFEGAPHETWLVVDATTGQNALHQAREFHEALGLTGIVLTKLDGTPKGGIVVAISDKLQIPIHFIGVGEKAEDLRPFDGPSFVEALFAA